ncbi:phage baseplate plug protein [Pantoea stewartii]|uniref:phage baseplate plug family protein n=1 Tax=Pantoea stewartii TaxID=66269 RepID=UPI003366D292
MTIIEMPLQPQNQAFSTTIAGNIWKITVMWRAGCWYLDLNDSTGSLIAGGIPLVTGADLLEQYAYLNLGFSLFVVCDADGQDYPTENDLGIGSHLFIRTE